MFLCIYGFCGFYLLIIFINIFLMIVSIADDSFDADTNFTISLFNETNNYVVQLKRPDSILSLDSDYIFTGKRRINNIPVDNYVSNRSYLIQSGTIIAEYTFASDFGFETSSGISSDVPTTFIQREISEVDVSYHNFCFFILLFLKNMFIRFCLN
jgi:hypothetical protein